MQMRLVIILSLLNDYDDDKLGHTHHLHLLIAAENAFN